MNLINQLQDGFFVPVTSDVLKVSDSNIEMANKTANEILGRMSPLENIVSLEAYRNRQLLKKVFVETFLISVPHPSGFTLQTDLHITSGTFVKPDDLTVVSILLTAAGGGALNGDSSPGGGGGGETIFMPNLTTTGDLTITLGSSGASGADGGNSTITGAIIDLIAYGGGRGLSNKGGSGGGRSDNPQPVLIDMYKGTGPAPATGISVGTLGLNYAFSIPGGAGGQNGNGGDSISVGGMMVSGIAGGGGSFGKGGDGHGSTGPGNPGILGGGGGSVGSGTNSGPGGPGYSEMYYWAA